MNKAAIKDLLFKMADDELILGHRNSEWTGLGPILEEDIAFSSMAQDKIGHALALYTILHEDFGEPEPDKLAFGRQEQQFKCSHLVEMPIGEYDFSLVRHFFFDHAEYYRYRLLENSSFERLANLTKKIRGELKYHVLHADTWMRKLGNGTEESNARMQAAINESFSLALGLFEENEQETALIDEGVFEGEKALRKIWLEDIKSVLKESNLKLPDIKKADTAHDGRKGFHTEHLKPLLEEMTEVFQVDPKAEW